MTPIDIIIIVVAGISTVFGLARGLVREIVGLAGLVAAFLLAALFGPMLGGMMSGVAPPLAARLIGYSGVFLLTLIAAALLGKLLTAAVEAAQLSCVNRLLGGVFGLIRGAAFILAICAGLMLFAPQTARWFEGSRLGTLAWQAARPLTRVVPGRQRTVDRPATPVTPVTPDSGPTKTM